MSGSTQRRSSVKVTEEIAERLADDAEAGYPPRKIQVRPTGVGAPVWRRGRGHHPPSTPGSMMNSLTCSSSALIATVSTSPTSSARRCGPTSPDPPTPPCCQGDPLGARLR